MNMRELRDAVLETCDRVLQDGHSLESISVSMQIDNSNDRCVQSTEPSINYDDNGCISDCVIHGVEN